MGGSSLEHLILKKQLVPSIDGDPSSSFHGLKPRSGPQFQEIREREREGDMPDLSSEDPCISKNGYIKNISLDAYSLVMWQTVDVL
jgi:hypothetical protein